jgi:adenylosuccinate synthase
MGVLRATTDGTVETNISSTYPFVTSSNTGLGGVLTGLSLGWRSIKEVVGVTKAVSSLVIAQEKETRTKAATVYY